MEIHQHPEGVAAEKRLPEDVEKREAGLTYDSVKSLRIPRKRFAVVRKYKSDLEAAGKVRIEIDDEITLYGNSIDVFTASSVINAIGRGFDYEEASLLFGDYLLYVIPISKDRKTLIRIRARLIGRGGRVRKRIEEKTKSRISIYGKTVSIIGKDEDLEMAREAVERLIEGKTHAVVFKFLEAKNKG